VPAENSEKNAARSTTLHIRNGAGMEDYFYIFAQRHFLYTGRCAQPPDHTTPDDTETMRTKTTISL
jgi:hypothetical protein